MARRLWKIFPWFIFLIAAGIDWLLWSYPEYFHTTSSVAAGVGAAVMFCFTGFLSRMFQGRRHIRSFLKSEENSEVLLRTGQHWLALAYNVWSDRAARYLLCVPALFATFCVTPFLLGWALWTAIKLPGKFEAWVVSLKGLVAGHAFAWLPGFMIPPAEHLLSVIPAVAQTFSAAIHGRTLEIVAWSAGIWALLSLLRRVAKATGRKRIAGYFSVGARLVLLGVVVCCITAGALDWLAWIYDILPDNSVAFGGYIPLIFAIPFEVRYVAEWSSLRFVVTPHRVIKRWGVFERHLRGLATNRIEDIDYDLDVVNRMFGYGDVRLVEFSGESHLTVECVPDPEHFANIVLENIHHVPEKGAVEEDI